MNRVQPTQFILLAVTGCAAQRESPATDIAIEKGDSYRVRVGAVSADQYTGGVRVHGTVWLEWGYRDLLPGVMRIEAIDAAGRSVRTQDAALLRLGKRTRSAKFSADLAIGRTDFQRLRIVHRLGH